MWSLEQLRQHDSLALGVHVDALGVLQERRRRQVQLVLDLRKTANDQVITNLFISQEYSKPIYRLTIQVVT